MASDWCSLFCWSGGWLSWSCRGSGGCLNGSSWLCWSCCGRCCWCRGLNRFGLWSSNWYILNSSFCWSSWLLNKSWGSLGWRSLYCWLCWLSFFRNSKVQAIMLNCVISSIFFLDLLHSSCLRSI